MSDPSAESLHGGASPSDAELGRRAALGDRVAFAAVVDRHGASMYRFARRIVGSDHDAEDVVQEAFVRAWKALPDYRGDAQLRTWLLTLTVNRARTLRRSRRATPVDDHLLSPNPAPEGEGPLAQLLGHELVDAVDAALQELPWRQRAVWVLYEVEGHGYAAIADTLGITTATVRGQLHRARRNLAARLARWR